MHAISNRILSSYANAILEITVSEALNIDTIINQLKVIGDNIDMQTMIKINKISRIEIKNLINRANTSLPSPTNKEEAVVILFVSYLIKRKHIRGLSAIINSINNIKNKLADNINIIVTIPNEKLLEDKITLDTKIANIVNSLYRSKTHDISYNVDQGIVFGFIIKIDNYTIINCSINNRLSQIKKNILNDIQRL